MNPLYPTSVLNASSAMSNPGSASKEVIAAPDTSTSKHTISSGPDKDWDVYIQKDGNGIKIYKALWRDRGFGREHRPLAPPPEIPGYRYQGEMIQSDVSTLTYVPSTVQAGAGAVPVKPSGIPTNPAANPDDAAWENQYPYGKTNALARKLKSYPAGSAEKTMYDHSRATGLVVEITPDGHAIPRGTGFLFRMPSDDYPFQQDDIAILTNDHVDKAINKANRYELWLGYENPSLREPEARIDLTDGPAVENKGLDYVLYQINNQRDVSTATRFNPLRLDVSSQPIIGSDVYLPNHGGGFAKGISYKDSNGRNTKIINRTSDLGSSFLNQTFTHNTFNLSGTSGSPIISRSSNRVVGYNFGGYSFGTGVDMRTIWSDIDTRLVLRARDHLDNP